MPELGDRFRRAVAGDEPRGGVDAVLGRVRRRERRRRVVSGAVAFAMFGGVAGGLWLATSGESPRRVSPASAPASSTVADEPSPPNEARIGCEEGRTVAHDPDVAAQPDGVHFVVENRSATWVAFEGMGHLEPGTTREFVFTFDPGRFQVACAFPPGDGALDGTNHAWIRVLDPHGYWTAFDPDCGAEEATGADFDLLPTAQGIPGAPEEVIASEFPGSIRPGDVVRAAGYPEAPAVEKLELVTVYALVRDGRTVASFDVSARPGETWLVSGYRACPGVVEPAGTGPSPSPEASVLCEAAGTEVRQAEVVAQPDGVHFVVENRADIAMWFSDFAKLQPGEVRSFVLPIGPGAREVFCRPDGPDGFGAPLTAAVNVQDPNAYWRSPEHDCAGGSVAITDLDSTPIEGDPADIARDYLQVHKESPEDEVVYGEYPEQRDPTFLVIHEGRVIVTFELEPRRPGVWVPAGLSMCV